MGMEGGFEEVNGESAEYYIRAGKYGKAFLQKLHEEIENMEFAPDGDHIYFSRDSDQMIQQGCKNKEPALLYLNAEIQRMGLDMKDEDILNLYFEAAECGSVHARLWLVYCDNRGLCTIPEPYRAQAVQWLKDADHPESVVLDELSFLEDRFEYLCDLADRADFMEDVIATDPEYEKIRDDTTEYPNPCWKTLIERSVALAEHIHDLAQPYCYKPYEYGTFEMNPSRGIVLYEEKKAWEIWCRERGFLHNAATPLT